MATNLPSMPGEPCGDNLKPTVQRALKARQTLAVQVPALPAGTADR
jgi:hypothetical protein